MELRQHSCSTYSQLYWYESWTSSVGNYKHAYWLVGLYHWISIDRKRCAGHFGLFVAKESVESAALNYAGITIAALSVFVYFPIKPTPQKSTGTYSSSEESEPLVGLEEGSINSSSAMFGESSAAKKAIGIALACLAGLLYGVNMLPVSHLQQQ